VAKTQEHERAHEGLSEVLESAQLLDFEKARDLEPRSPLVLPGGCAAGLRRGRLRPHPRQGRGAARVVRRANQPWLHPGRASWFPLLP